MLFRLCKCFQRQRKDLRKSLACRVVECILRCVGGKRLIVQGKWRGARENAQRPLIHLHNDRSAYALLRLIDEGIERLPKRREPEAVIHDVGIIFGKLRLRMSCPLIKCDALELLMCKMKERSSRCFIYLSGFDTHKTILDHIQAANTMSSGSMIKRANQLDAVHSLVVQSNWYTMFEGDRDLLRFIRCCLGRYRTLIRIFRWGYGRIFEHATLDAGTPQVLVDRIGIRFRRLDWNATFCTIRDLFFTRMERPMADGSDDTKVRSKRPNTRIKTDLIVAFTCAAVRDHRALFFSRHFHERLGKQGSAKRRRERIRTFV